LVVFPYDHLLIGKWRQRFHGVSGLFVDDLCAALQQRAAVFKGTTTSGGTGADGRNRRQQQGAQAMGKHLD
jgi:hypothetical protein